MELQIKFNIKVFLIMIFYVLLGSLGLYNGTILVLFPLVNIPMAYCMIKDNWSTATIVGVNGIVGLILFFVPGNITGLFMYLVFVGLVSYLIRYYYKNDYTIPHMILYTGLIITGVLLAYIGVFRLLGLDLIGLYMELLEEYKVIMLNQVEYVVESNIQLMEQRHLLYQAIELQIEVIKLLYPALGLGMMWGAITVNILLLKVTTKIRRITFTSFRQIGQFKFSRQLLVLFVFGVLCTQLDYPLSFAMGTNILIITIMLLEVIGGITCIVLMSRSEKPLIIKLGLGFLSLALFLMFPLILMIVGVFDTLLDLKKVDIIV